MLKIVNGNVLEAKENLILHQVNEYGSMGGGIALQISKRYPHIEYSYKEYCKGKSVDQLLGNYVAVNTDESNKQYIVNCFTQRDYNTNYEALEKVFKKIKDYAMKNNLSMCIPFKYGSGIANGDFTKILEILLDIFTDYDLVIYRLDV